MVKIRVKIKITLNRKDKLKTQPHTKKKTEIKIDDARGNIFVTIVL